MLRKIFFILLAVVASGCVTEGGPGRPQIDKKKALEANVKLGMNYLQRGERDRALTAFLKAREIDGRSAEAMQGIAMIRQLNGEMALADKAYQRALSLRSDHGREAIALNYARFLYKGDRCKDAIPLLKPASVNIGYPSRDTALYILGLCSLKFGDRARAKGAFEHAINLNARNALAAIEIAELNFEDGDYSVAKKNLDIFVAYANQSARSLWLGIRIERVFGNRNNEASLALALKNMHPYSNEYLQYKNSKK